MILKNEMPILEYDDSSAEVIAPDHDCEGLKLPEKCLFAFLGDVVHTYAESSRAEVVLELITVSQTIKIYVLRGGRAGADHGFADDQDLCASRGQ